MARKIADHKMTPERQDAIQTLSNMGFMPMYLGLEMCLVGRVYVDDVKAAIAKSDNPAYFNQRFEFNQ
tara:strand:+ start:779 stop:982 length:204 start_codon:yes stop_codon:yes gene_type:complete